MRFSFLQTELLPSSRLRELQAKNQAGEPAECADDEITGLVPFMWRVDEVVWR
jgi:hypothetical protein